MMTSRLISVLIFGAALAVSGCVGTMDVSRDAGPDALPVIENIQVQDWDVVGVEVNVPTTLTTSEANGIKPRADIVWHGDPMGDRHAQVDALMTAALAPAFEAVNGAVPVIVSLEVTEFHAQTHRVRYSNIPSEHEIVFVMTVYHAETGEVLSGPNTVDLTFAGLNGTDAIAADAAGISQRVRISERLASWVSDEFIGPAADTILVASN